MIVHLYKPLQNEKAPGFIAFEPTEPSARQERLKEKAWDRSLIHHTWHVHESCT